MNSLQVTTMTTEQLNSGKQTWNLIADFLNNYQDQSQSLQQQQQQQIDQLNGGSTVVLRNKNDSLFTNHKLTLNEAENEAFDWLFYHLEQK